jgi:hypothetical protein
MPLVDKVQPEVLMAAGYVVVLIVIALGLERAARLVYQRSERYETAGFRYHAPLDAWECPMGEHLLRFEVAVHDRPYARYRARASTCNACPIKAQCTDSNTGRVLERPLEDWPRSEVARLYRGVSLMLVGLAVFITSLGLARNHEPADVLILGSAMGLALLVGYRLWPAFKPVR